MSAKILADLFGPMAEVALFATEGGAPLEIHNALSFRHQDQCLGNRSIQRETLSNGVEVKSAIVEWGEQLLRIRLDLSAAQALHQQLDYLVGAKKQVAEPLANYLETYLRKHRLTVAGMDRHQKRDLVHHLHSAGYFRYKKASEEIASRLQLSRATIYNYLHESD